MSRVRETASAVLDFAMLVAVSAAPALFQRMNPSITVREPRSTQRCSQHPISDTRGETASKETP